MKTEKVGYKFRFYPNEDQKKYLAKVFGHCRFVYNWGLGKRKKAYEEKKENVTYCMLSKMLTDLRKQPEFIWLNEVPRQPTDQALRHLEAAFKNFFDRIKKKKKGSKGSNKSDDVKEKAGYPKFKSRYGRQKASFCQGFKWDLKEKTLRVSGIGTLKGVQWSRNFKSSPSTVTISKDCANRYFVTLCLKENFEEFPKTYKSVGIDMGINDLMILSTGEKISNIKCVNKYQQKLGDAQRVHSRRKKGSGRNDQARLVTTKIHNCIADARNDWLHKATTDIVKKYDIICIENLNVEGMVKNHHLARSIEDASWGEMKRMLEYKCKRYGKILNVVDRFFPSSKRCNVCGYVMESLPLPIREWRCPVCQSYHDRDINAAKNILAAGTSLDLVQSLCVESQKEMMTSENCVQQ